MAFNIKCVQASNNNYQFYQQQKTNFGLQDTCNTKYKNKNK